MRPLLHVHLLGDFLVISNDMPVTTISIPRVQSLFAYLLLHRSAPQNRSHLAFLLWPDSTEAQAHTNLRQLIYHLRQSLPDAQQFLRIDKHGIQWSPAQSEVSWTLDVQEIEQAFAQADQAELIHDTTRRRQALEQVMRLYRGDLLPGCYDEWILPERDRLRELFFSAAFRLTEFLEEEREYSTAIVIARRLLRENGLHEATYRQLMRLYALQGDRSAALRAYHTCVAVLEREMGIEPSEATRGIYEALLQSNTTIVTPTNALLTREIMPPLLGRKAEWRLLQEIWRKVTGGQRHVVLLSGEAGIGKTRLAEEMEAWVSRQGMATMNARCYAAPGQLAYAPLTSWLRNALQTGLSTLDPIFLTEIARLVPEVLVTHPNLSHPLPMKEGWQRQQFFEALARVVLSTRQPLLLLLDDLHCCDNETLEWLHYFLRFDPAARLLLIGTVRVEETLPDHPLRTFLGTLQRDALLIEIALGPLTTAETFSLAESVMGKQLDPALANNLYTETEGNPLFVVEMARAGRLGQSQAEPLGPNPPPTLLTQSASTLPPVVQSVLAARLAQLSPAVREIASVAAVIGREFPFAVLAHASQTSEESMVRGLDELWQRRIVCEQGIGIALTYDFSHGKLREQIYVSLTPGHRRLLHRRVAEAFTAVYLDSQHIVSGQIAAHYERAGLPDQAIPYYQRAGSAAMDIYANAEAIAAFERAAALLFETGQVGNTRQEKQREMTTQVYESLGDIFVVIGQFQQARQVYQQAIAFLPPGESFSRQAGNVASATHLQPGQSGKAAIWLARLQRKIAGSWNHVSNNPQDDSPINARQAFQEAEHLLMAASEPENPAWRHEWIELQIARIWPMRGSVDDLTKAIEKARPLVEQSGTAEQRELFSYAVATRDLIRRRYITSISEEKKAAWRSLVTALEQTGNKNKLGFCLLGFGSSFLWSNQTAEAEGYLVKALHVGEQMGNLALQIRSLTFLSLVYRKCGQVEQVDDLLTRAQTTGAAQNNRILTGQCAWVAWRKGNLIEAQTYGLAALERQRDEPDMDAFHWVSAWPLFGIALAQEKSSEVMNYVRMVLDPTQQPAPESINTLLESALQAWDAGTPEETSALLQQVVPLARDMGYL